MHVAGEDFGGGVEVGDGAGYFEDAVVGAGRHVEAGHGAFKYLHGFGDRTGVGGDEAWRHLCVAVYGGLVGKAVCLDIAGFIDAGTDGGRGFSRPHVLQFGEWDGHYFHLYVYTVGDFILPFCFETYHKPKWASHFHHSFLQFQSLPLHLFQMIFIFFIRGEPSILKLSPHLFDEVTKRGKDSYFYILCFIIAHTYDIFPIFAETNLIDIS